MVSTESVFALAPLTAMVLAVLCAHVGTLILKTNAFVADIVYVRLLPNG